MGGEQRLVEAIVSIAEKRLLPPIAALCHMVREAGEDEAGKASHVRGLVCG
jgi:hypothetical protein